MNGPRVITLSGVYCIQKVHPLIFRNTTHAQVPILISAQYKENFK